MEQVTSMEKVTRPDGATITFTRQGSGDPILLVHGGPSSGEAWAEVVPHLESRFRVVTMDRRGRGRSTDGGAEYSLDLEAADIATVIEAIGDEVNVVAHSSGARMALHAATRDAGMRSLVLYEPPLAFEHAPADLWDRLEELVDAGDSSAAVELFMLEIAATPEEVEVVKNIGPVWERLCAAIQTAPREGRALVATPIDLDAVGRIDVPVLILIGEQTTLPLFLDGLDELERALPDVRQETLPGQRHMATAFAPELFARRIESFLVSLD